MLFIFAVCLLVLFGHEFVTTLKKFIKVLVRMTNFLILKLSLMSKYLNWKHRIKLVSYQCDYLHLFNISKNKRFLNCTVFKKLNLSVILDILLYQKLFPQI